MSDVGEELAEIVEHDEEEAEEAETALVPVPSATLFGSNDPVEVIARASSTASALAEVVRRQNLASTIQGREFVRVEGWTLLGSMLGVFPVVAWTHEVLDDGGGNLGWEARVEARTREGQVVGAAEAECLRSEKTWKSRDSYALRSMSQTRATSKALRGPLGFVMTLAGFEATPQEEIPPEELVRSDGKKPPTIARSNREWLQRMSQLEVPKAEQWARAAAAETGLGHDDLLTRLNRALLDLTDGPNAYDPFMLDPNGAVQAAFAAAFDGLLLEPPVVEVSDTPPGQEPLPEPSPEDPHAREEGA